MDVDTFRNELNKLIQVGCTEISASYVGDVARNVVYKGCKMSGTAEQYLRIEIEQPAGYVLADFSQYPNIAFRVSDTPREGDLHVVGVEKEGNAAIIRVVTTTES